MSSAAGHHHFIADSSIADLPMEVSPAFFPPPTVRVPAHNIPQLRNYEYSFARERAAIACWDRERLARLALAEREQQHVAQEEQTLRQRELNDVEEEEEEGQKTRREEDEEKKKRIEEDEGKKKIREETEEEEDLERPQQPQSEELSPTAHPHGGTLPPVQMIPLLRPTPISQQQPPPPLQPRDEGGGVVLAEAASTANGTGATRHQQSPGRHAYSLDVLEEFETKRDLFDLLELRSLDDRRELAQLLLANGTASNDSTNSLPSSTAGTSALQQQQQLTAADCATAKRGASRSHTNVLM